ncbi:NAD(P)-dependent oxidoreductase [Magnetospirillum sp. 64-120]|uniref:NAD-dependent epimerase/dehydratase family protein n=1 Tax=Magnetospirillum sp. 64-120 TaxID=1895778 RepID=UPI0025C2332A|nr:NAD(P)-dependent oxidoreductase [Magnetospirillum sp. 64-120]
MSPNAISEPGGIVVTGGAGFVGAPLTALLLAHGPVTVVDDLSVGRPMPTPATGLTCLRADIRDRAAMAAIIARHRPRTIVHLAAIHHIPTCERDPARAMDVNVMGFQSVLDAAAQGGCRHVVLASSGAVYDWSDGPLAETAPLAPRDVYAASKAANEHQLTAWTMAGHGHGCVARMFNVIGPDDPNGHLIPDILARLGEAVGAQVRLRLGNLDTRRDFVDLRDMAAGLAALVTRPPQNRPTPEVFNLCSGRDHSAADIALALAAQLGVTATLVTDPALCRPVDRPGQLGVPDKARAELGWSARHDLDASLAAIVRWWRQRIASCA